MRISELLSKGNLHPVQELTPYPPTLGFYTLQMCPTFAEGLQFVVRERGLREVCNPSTKPIV